MNNSIYFILILLAGISCSVPEKHTDLSDVFKSLSEQKQFYYNVEYSILKPQEGMISSLYGTVSLNRNSESGISSAYFGLSDKNMPNYLHSIYLKHEWISELSSNSFDYSDVDLIADSLHSPILINPELLFKIEADSVRITEQEINEKSMKWIFDLKQKTDQVVIMWDKTLNKVTELEYKYDVNSENTYSRKWTFEYLAKTEYNTLASSYKQQNQIARQPFL
ncbi:hypothetical protein [Marivirga sp.]|uniref:hypothetical protein n=1 Tax=Marivirga sp. TaxID=2018662 RepID=UPI0025E9DA55|nr:hypothetical protein [Marivirga sp.]